MFRFEKCFYVDVLDFQIELWRKYLGNFWVWHLFGLLFPNIGQKFFWALFSKANQQIVYYKQVFSGWPGSVLLNFFTVVIYVFS